MEEMISSLQSDLHRLNAKLIQLAWKIDDVAKMTPYEPSMDYQDELVNISSRLDNIEERFESYSSQVNELDFGLPPLPETKLLSHTLWKRMWAVFGHGVLGNTVLTILIITLVTIIRGP